MSVTDSTIEARVYFEPMMRQVLERNRSTDGARSSCSVQPRVNHLLLPNSSQKAGSEVSMSWRSWSKE